MGAQGILARGAYLAIASSGGKELSLNGSGQQSDDCQSLLQPHVGVGLRCAQWPTVLTPRCGCGRPDEAATAMDSFDRQSDAEGLVVMESERVDGSSWLITSRMGTEPDHAAHRGTVVASKISGKCCLRSSGLSPGKRCIGRPSCASETKVVTSRGSG